MEFIGKLLLFIVFLVVFGGWIALANYVQTITSAWVVKGRYFLIQELTTLINLIPIFGLTAILTRFFDFNLFLLFFGSLQLGVILTFVLATFFGVTTHQKLVKISAAIYSGGVEFGIRNAKLSQIVTVGVGLVILLVYPIVVGYTYFSHDIPSDEATRLIFRYTLLFLYLLGLTISFPLNVALLVSENLDEASRRFLFAGIMSNLIYSGILLALVLWSFGLGSRASGIEVALGSVDTRLTSTFMVVLTCYFLVVAIIPYLLGSQRGKNRRLEFRGQQVRHLENLLDIIKFPRSADENIAKLDDLQSQIDSEIASMAQSDVWVDTGNMIDTDASVVEELSQHPKTQSMVDAYRASRENDIRFSYIDFLRKTKGEINEVAALLKTAEKDRLEAMIKLYEDRQKKLQTEEEQERKMRPLLVGAVAFIGTAALGEVVSQLAVQIADAFAQNLR